MYSEASAAALPAPKPARVHWSTILFAVGMAICGIALLATIAGVPASMSYDANGPSNRNKPTHSDPLGLSASIDGNMKWLDEMTNDKPGHYVGLINSIDASESAIGIMAGAVLAMDESVKNIDSQLQGVANVTTQMQHDMVDMAATSALSAKRMNSLGSDIGMLSSTMAQLAASTARLTTSMSGIEKAAATIAGQRMAAALANTKALSTVLPDGIPAPTTDIPMPAGAAGVGGGVGPAPAAATANANVNANVAGQPQVPFGATPARGAQPAAPPTGHVIGGVR